MSIIHELQDMRYLEWTRTRHSSGTAGSFLKSYEKIGRKKYYYKLSNYDAVNGIVGHECVNEIVVDRLLMCLGIEHLEYTLIHALVQIRGIEYETYLCRSEDFKRKGDKKIALDAFYEMEAEDGETPLEFCERYHFRERIDEMLLVDYLILNRDRHGANIEVLKSSRNHTLRLSPLFDHGLSLLFSQRGSDGWDLPDPLEDRRIQCFVGGMSAYENLVLIRKEDLRRLPDFDGQMMDRIFDGLEEVMGPQWIRAVWNFLTVRAKAYEDFCDQRS